ncbi:MAG: replicative DNA helicase [Rickettsia sp.]|nr:replicative DNA helicase [Rickettsia sp.]
MYSENLPTELQRKLPYDLQVERILLGALIVKSDLIYKINVFLKPEHFYDKLHQIIYKTIEDILSKDIIVSDLTISSVLEKKDIFEQMDGKAYIVKLTTLSMLVINPREYAKIIYDLALKRSLIDIGEEIVNRAYDNSVIFSSTEQLEIAETKLYNLSSYGTVAKNTEHITSSLDKNIKKIGLSKASDQHISGVSTGFASLDKILFGFHNSDLVIIAGRPGMGKTSLAMNFALNLANLFSQQKKETNSKENILVFFSLEMSSEQLSMKLLSMVSRINSDNLRNGSIGESQYSDLIKHSQKLKEMPFFIDDTAYLSINALKIKIRKLQRKYNLKILFIDYLQLMQSSKSYNSRVLEVSDITQGLKNIAKELDIPIVVLSQLSRSVEQRQDKRPMLYDLRDSGAIEQDADIVMFIYREQYYLNHQEPDRNDHEQHHKWAVQMSQKNDIAEVIIAKHRNGSVGKIDLHYNPEFSKFEEKTI